ncbi:hypothetical protein SAMN04489796_102337 [Winogradskyella thalassocola]|uniref:Uncharacterized protein n=1 Tax=Winogradskyella thalassocola TaxID=262004 RepID=A0A1G8BI09_9FLAO|nr:hypothetical protein SAMN04489796_102337 [Winogradskyella thalassocola]
MSTKSIFFGENLRLIFTINLYCVLSVFYLKSVYLYVILIITRDLAQFVSKAIYK